MCSNEIFDLIHVTLKLKDRISELCKKIDYLAQSPSITLSAKYIDEKGACKLLCVSPRTLAKMRTDGIIPYLKIRRRILYHASDLTDYLDKNCKR